MGLMDEIKAAREARDRAAQQPVIPLTGQVTPQPVSKNAVSHALAQPTNELANSQPALGKVENVAPAQVVPTLKLNPIKVSASPALVLAPVVPAASIPVLDVKLDTFNEGTDKYTPEEMEQIKSSLEFMRNNFEHPEIVGEAMKTIMMSINENPHLADILEHKDIGTMVRAMRESYGIHVAKAETRKSGGSGSRGGKKKPGELEVDLGFGNIFAGN